jgi:glucose uptake protein
MVTLLLAVGTVVAWGLWIPAAQVVPGVPQSSRTFYATLANALFAAGALAAGGGHVGFGWKVFWLPVVGGFVWTAGNYSAFQAAEAIGLARAAGSWTPLNIITAFVWGALLFGELDGFSAARFVVIAAALLLVIAGVVCIVSSQDAGPTPPSLVLAGSAGSLPEAREPVGPQLRARRGFAWAVAAGVLWGSYFVPAQWANVPAQVSNFPLALGILAAGTVLALSTGGPARLAARTAAVQLGAGLLFGIGNLTLLGLVARVGTGAGFTIAQLSLVVNAGVGIYVLKVPRPGSRPAHIALAGIVLAGVGGTAIGALR